jgi:hypothetical protein
MIGTAALQVGAVSAQGWRDRHADLAGAMQHDPFMKGFVDKHSKRASNQFSVSSGTVHVIYLVPADKAARHDYKVALRKAILEIRAFYQEELGLTPSKGRKAVGKTFDIIKPRVEVVVTPHDSAYYNANNQAGQFEFFFRAVEDRLRRHRW